MRRILTEGPLNAVVKVDDFLT